MKWYEGVANALKKGECFSQGDYRASTKYYRNNGGYITNVFYYGHKVFTYRLKPTLNAPNNEKHKYDFCGYEGYPRTTKLINCCLEAVGAKYRVKTVKDKIVEVPVTSKTARYN